MAQAQKMGETINIMEETGGGSGRVRVLAPVSSMPPDPEVTERPVRRKFTADYKLRILREADQCQEGELGALLRREGLYSSHLVTWRRQREQAEQEALMPKKRGRKPMETNPLTQRVTELERENERLKHGLEQAEVIIEVQKISKLLEIPLSLPGNDGNG